MKLSEALDSGWEPTDENGRYRFRYRQSQTGHMSSRIAVVVNCSICGDEMLQDIQSSKKSRTPVCSNECMGKRTAGMTPSRKKVDRYLRNGYWLLRDPTQQKTHPKGWIFEHKKVILETHGLDELPEDSAIHHLNGDKLDNRPENLALLHRTDHLALHRMVKNTLEMLFQDIISEETYYHIVSIGEGISQEELIGINR